MFYQLKITRKGTKPPVWRRCTVAADVTFANMAAMLEKLVQYPAGSLYEIEFFQKKVQIRENGDGEAKNNFTLLNAGRDRDCRAYGFREMVYLPSVWCG